uniref:Fibulin-7-like n=1 Tax=Sinocyclocheilus rhinocerous TaxID=307959 RepID=A0A673JDD8_9TELE
MKCITVIHTHLKGTVHPIMKICLKCTPPQAAQSVDEFVSSFAHLLTDGSSAVNGCRQNESPNMSDCPPPEPLANGWILGNVFKFGHEVHFLCSSGFQLMGPETRVCLDSQDWSGAQPSCKCMSQRSLYKLVLFPVLSVVDTTVNNDASTSVSNDPNVIEHCVCVCVCVCVSDTDECELFRLTRPGRLCLHTCVNTAGSFHCECPAGYSLGRDSRSCHDIDECARATYTLTFGLAFQRLSLVSLPPRRYDRNPCIQGDNACFQAPVSINFHFMSVVSNMSTPTILFRLSAARILGDTLRFGLLGNRGVQHFSVQRSGRLTGQLVLVNSL